MTRIAEVTFWLAVAAVLYPYAGYPALLWLAGKVRRKSKAGTPAELPSVTMIIPVRER